MVDVEVDRRVDENSASNLNYVHFFIKSSKNLVPNQPTASSFLSHKPPRVIHQVGRHFNNYYIKIRRELNLLGRYFSLSNGDFKANFSPRREFLYLL